jgi:hypothetical protein
LAVFFFVLGTLFVGLVPLWESPDEPSHFSHVYYLLLHRNLPRPGFTVFDQIQLYEARHPPLYYAAAATFLALWEKASPSDTLEIVPNPDVACTPERNRFEHEGIGWFRGPSSPYALRFFSLAVAGAAPLFTALLALRLFPRRPAIAALAFLLHGCFPQFLFISSSINNDCLVQALSAIVLYLLCLQLLLRKASWTLPLLGGLAIAGSAASKASGLVWLALALPVALLANRHRLRTTLCLLGPSLLSGSVILLATSLRRGGSGLPEYLYRRLASAQGPVFSIGSLSAVSESLWACFGWVDLPPTPTINSRVTLLATLLLIVGWISLWRNGVLSGPVRRPLLLIAAVPVVFLISIGVYTTPLGKAQGRFLFPAMGAIALVMAYALAEISAPLAKRGPPVMIGLVSCVLVLASVACVYRVILPAYRYTLPEGLLPGTRQCRSNSLTFPVVPLQEQGQAFGASADMLTRIDIKLATHSRSVAGRLNLQVCHGIPPGNSSPIRTAVADVAAVRDNEYHTFGFPPIPDSADKQFYFYLEAPGASTVNAVSVRMYDRPLPENLGLGRRFRRHEPLDGALTFTSYYITPRPSGE